MARAAAANTAAAAAEPQQRRRSARIVKLEQDDGATNGTADEEDEGLNGIEHDEGKRRGKKGGRTKQPAATAATAAATKGPTANGRKRRVSSSSSSSFEHAAFNGVAVKKEKDDNDDGGLDRGSTAGTPNGRQGRGKRIKTEDEEEGRDVDGSEAGSMDMTSPASKAQKTTTPSPRKSGRRGVKDEHEGIKDEHEDSKDNNNNNKKPGSKAALTTAAAEAKAEALQARKLKSYTQYANKNSPFPDFARPTPEECKLAHKILASIHGKRERSGSDTVAPKNRAGCGDSPSVLDALVRTILSQNTSDKNSTRAKLNMDRVYGGSDNWASIVEGGEGKLQKAIESGGLSVVKSRVIIGILKQAKEKYGEYSLDHLFDATNDEAMTEMLSFQGVGPKTASCVLLFCLRRESFAVDTHVHRITGLLGWRPASASREEAHAHLDARVPDEDKYGLHILLVTHGKKCDECKAGGRSVGKCELRKAFRGAKLAGTGGEDVKDEEEEEIKEEEIKEEEDKKAVVKAEED